MKCSEPVTDDGDDDDDDDDVIGKRTIKTSLYQQ